MVLFFTITDQCDITARSAGPPAAIPSTALTTGTMPSNSATFTPGSLVCPGKTV